MAAVSEARIGNRVSFLNDLKLPAVVTAETGENLPDLLAGAAQEITQIRLRHGAILFRGFSLVTPEDFYNAVAPLFGNHLRTYVGGISPRGQVMPRVYESTRFPPHLRIRQHNEMSYLPDPPRYLAFFCEVAPVLGGETPLSDSRLVYKRIPASLLAKFEEHGVHYHRHLYGPRRNVVTRALSRIIELHTSWMEAFGTNDPVEVERICAEHGATVRWNWEESAFLSNTLPACRQHPETGENLWFNQATTFVATPRSAGLVPWLMYRLAYPLPHRRPFHATFGNGRPIPFADLDRVNDAIDGATVRFRWRPGDLLLVDNFLVAHGRMSFRGPRRILVAIH